MKPRSLKAMIGCALMMLVGSAWAQKIELLQNLSQRDFRLLSEDIGAAISYHPQTPTEPLGITGFDVGLSLTASKLANKDVVARASSDSVPSYLLIPTLRANKGLPLGFDVGLMYSTIPGSNIALWGGEARWALLRGGIAEPAVGVRGTFTKLTGVDQLDMNTKSFDISASKGFAVLTPYIGVGRTWISSEPHAGTLSKEDFALTKLFFGAGFKMLLFNMNAEVDRTGPSTAYSLKAGIRF
ncbi:MAG TPA: hypothetical protein VM183_02605 [Burkholderiales bacterium]|nr:hypothetical protein [Burkholderiales bacterium]